MQSGTTRIIAGVRNLWYGVLRRLGLGQPPALPTAPVGRPGAGRDPVSRPARNREECPTPEELCRPLDLSAFNSRVRIGRQPEGESWRSVLVVDLCGTIQAPTDGCEVELRVSLKDVTDREAESSPVLNRPRQGPLNPSSHFLFQADMGRLCRQTTVLEDWTTVGQISPEWFVLARGGRRTLRYTTAVVSPQTGEQLACSDSRHLRTTATGYLD